jgi:hypothetical protein
MPLQRSVYLDKYSRGGSRALIFLAGGPPICPPKRTVLSWPPSKRRIQPLKTAEAMIILLFIPLGMLCLVLSLLCLRIGRLRHALTCALFGLFFLGAAALLSYGTGILIEKLNWAA